MKRYVSDYPAETLKEILDTLSVEDLKSLGSQIQKKLPSRHGEIVEFLCDQMKADKLPLMCVKSWTKKKGMRESKSARRIACHGKFHLADRRTNSDSKQHLTDK